MLMGEKIKFYMKKKGMSLVQLSSLSGINKYRIENILDCTRYPSMAELKTFCSIFHCSLPELQEDLSKNTLWIELKTPMKKYWSDEQMDFPILVRVFNEDNAFMNYLRYDKDGWYMLTGTRGAYNKRYLDISNKQASFKNPKSDYTSCVDFHNVSFSAR